MNLSLFNSLTRQKETFKPINENQVKMYVCGMTVYDDCHLGHARSMVSFDVVVRHLRFLGFDVTFVKNITDIDDKIIKRAAENNESIQDLTNRVIASVRKDEKALNITAPDIQPKATEYVDEMIDLIDTLIKKEAAYIAENGDVVFSVKSFKEYGKLSKKDLEGLEAGRRIEVQMGKKNPFDFVLWKKAKPEEPYWDSPFGKGRPGWHIECSAMIKKTLGITIDIHGGGGDLQFPHHENEIAQSESANEAKFVNYWMHGGLLQVDEEKMSKSLGNFTTIKESLKENKPEVLRFLLMSSHYRSALSYSKSNLELAKSNLTKLYRALDLNLTSKDELLVDKTWVEKYKNVMNDDFNTPQAIAVLFELANASNKETEKAKKNALANTLYYLGQNLGLFSQEAKDFLSVKMSDADIAEIDALIIDRNEARKNKDFAKADSIRDRLLAENIEILDLAGGKTSWRRLS